MTIYSIDHKRVRLVAISALTIGEHILLLLFLAEHVLKHIADRSALTAERSAPVVAVCVDKGYRTSRSARIDIRLVRLVRDGQRGNCRTNQEQDVYQSSHLDACFRM